MAFTTIKDQTVNGFRIRLVDQSIAAFALIVEGYDSNVTSIEHRTIDPVCAGILFKRTVALAEKEMIIHPAWKRRRIEIA